MSTFHQTTRFLASIIGLGLLTTGVVACGSDEVATSSGGPTNIQKQALTSDVRTAPSSAAAATQLGTASPSMKTKTAQAPSKLVPIAMRAGTHQGFDRVVIELAGDGTPGWHVDYAPVAQQQASGNELRVQGQSFLNVNIDGTTYPFEVGMEAKELTPVSGEGPAVAEVVSGGTFEGRSQFVIGLKGDRLPYSVTYLEDPKRIVIDFQN